LISSNTSSLFNSSYKVNDATCMRVMLADELLLCPHFASELRFISLVLSSVARARLLLTAYPCARPRAIVTNLHGMGSSIYYRTQTELADVLFSEWLLDTISTATGCRAPSCHTILQQATRFTGNLDELHRSDKELSNISSTAYENCPFPPPIGILENSHSPAQSLPRHWMGCLNGSELHH
jgi:hypothetical protein